MKPMMMLIALGAGACLTAAGFLAMGPQNTGGAPVEKVELMVAKAEIPVTAALTQELVEVKEYPKDLVPPGAFLNAERNELLNAEKKYYSLIRVNPGAILSRDMFAQGRGPKEMLTEGFRAISIPVNDPANMVGNFISPGDFVDVICTLTTDGDDDDVNGGALSRVIMRKVKLLAVGDTFTVSGKADGKQERARHVTFALKPDQATLVQLASNQGTLSLMLRSNSDDEEAAPADVAVTKTALLTGSAGVKTDGEGGGKYEAGMEELRKELVGLKGELDAIRNRPTEPGAPAVQRADRPQELTIQVFRGSAPSQLRIKMPPKKSS